MFLCLHGASAHSLFITHIYVQSVFPDLGSGSRSKSAVLSGSRRDSKVSTFQTMDMGCYIHTIFHSTLPGDGPKRSSHKCVQFCLLHFSMRSNRAQEYCSKPTHACFSWDSKEVVGLFSACAAEGNSSLPPMSEMSTHKCIFSGSLCTHIWSLLLWQPSADIVTWEFIIHIHMYRKMYIWNTYINTYVFTLYEIYIWNAYNAVYVI